MSDLSGITSSQKFCDAVFTEAMASAKKRGGTIAIGDLNHAVQVLVTTLGAAAKSVDVSKKTPVTEFLLKAQNECLDPVSVAGEIAKIFLQASTEAPELWTDSWKPSTVRRLEAFGKILENMSEVNFLETSARKAIDIATKRFGKTALTPEPHIPKGFRTVPKREGAGSEEVKLSVPGGFQDILMTLAASVKALKDTFVLWVQRMPYKQRKPLLDMFASFVTEINKVIETRPTMQNPLSKDLCEKLRMALKGINSALEKRKSDPMTREMQQMVFQLFGTVNSLPREPGASLL